jgi:hypothetical protein
MSFSFCYETFVYQLKDGGVLIDTLLKTGENFATFIRISELDITSVPQMISSVMVVYGSLS